MIVRQIEYYRTPSSISDLYFHRRSRCRELNERKDTRASSQDDSRLLLLVMIDCQSPLRARDKPQYMCVVCEPTVEDVFVSRYTFGKTCLIGPPNCSFPSSPHIHIAIGQRCFAELETFEELRVRSRTRIQRQNRIQTTFHEQLSMSNYLCRH